MSTKVTYKAPVEPRAPSKKLKPRGCNGGRQSDIAFLKPHEWAYVKTHPSGDKRRADALRALAEPPSKKVVVETKDADLQRRVALLTKANVELKRENAELKRRVTQPSDAKSDVERQRDMLAAQLARTVDELKARDAKLKETRLLMRSQVARDTQQYRRPRLELAVRRAHVSNYYDVPMCAHYPLRDCLEGACI